MRLIENVEAYPDREFLEIVERIVSTVVEESGARELYLVEIKNWFDRKWGHYSGKNLVPFWLKTTTVPPFTPSRLLTERYFRRIASGDLLHATPDHPLYLREKQSFSVRRPKRISEISDSAVFAWYSSHATENRRGSLMIYVSTENAVRVWYAGFRREDVWQLHITKEISREAVLELMSGATASGLSRADDPPAIPLPPKLQIGNLFRSDRLEANDLECSSHSG